MRIMPSGRARISVRRPRAMGECDRSGFWYPLDSMVKQFEWAGNELVDTGLLVGFDQVDKPFDQYRAPILPADPIPRVNPRPSPNVTGTPNIGAQLPPSPDNQNFQQYILGGSFIGLPGAPSTFAAVLGQIAANSGIATPANIISAAVALSPANQAITLATANVSRSFLVLFNPTSFPAQFALAGTTNQGNIRNLSIGPNEAYFWATAYGGLAPYTGPIVAIGLFPGLPLWVFQDTGLLNDGGVVQLDPSVTDWPTTDAGLPPGAVWNDGNVVAIVPGLTGATSVLFASVTAASLLATGTGNLPTSNPGDGSGLLWNNSGLLCTA